ncbi:MAG: peptide ABC transporter substrate-binding protein [Pseudomonadota bacterium]
MTLMRTLNALAISSLAAMLAACGGGDDTSAYGELLRRGISANPDTLDPHKSSAQWENIVIGDMLEGLYIQDAGGRPVPGMAESVDIDETQTVYTFTLRDATWSDGVPVTADDFVFSFQRLQNPETAAQYASLLWLIKNAKAVNSGTLPPEEMGVRSIDAKTLEITLEYPAPYLPGLLTHYSSFPVPKHVVEEYGDGWIRPENIQVNGPYKLQEWTIGAQLVSTKNDAWHGGSENLCFDTVAYFPIADHGAVERRIEAGTLDINNAFDGPRKAQLDERLPGWVRTDPSLTVTYWVFNADIPPFDDVRVRQALTMVLDREFMTENVLTPGFIPAYSFVPPGIDNYVDPEEQFTYEWALLPREARIEKARELLEAAGFGPENPLEFTYIYRNTGDNPKPPPVAQANWQDIGDWVRPTLEQQDTKVLYSRLRTGDFEVSDAGWVADFNDPHNFLYLLDSDTGQLNYGSYANAQYDAKIAASNLELDLEARAEILADAEAEMLQEYPLSPMWFLVNQNLVDPSLSGWEDNVVDVHRSRYLCRTE